MKRPTVLLALVALLALAMLVARERRRCTEPGGQGRPGRPSEDIRLVRRTARLHEAACAPPHGRIRARRRDVRRRRADRGAGRRQRSGSPRHRLFDDERAGGRRRRARPRQVERLDALRRPLRPPHRRRRARAEATAHELTRAAAGRELRAAPARQQAPRPLPRRRLSGRRHRSRNPRADPARSAALDPHRGGHARPRGHARRAQPLVRDRDRHRSPRRLDCEGRHGLEHAAGVAVRDSRRCVADGRESGHRQEPGGRSHIADRQLAARLRGEGPTG